MKKQCVAMFKTPIMKPRNVCYIFYLTIHGLAHTTTTLVELSTKHIL